MRRKVLLTGAVCSIASYIALFFTLSFLPARVVLPFLGGVVIGVNEASFSAALAIAVVSIIMALSLPEGMGEAEAPSEEVAKLSSKPLEVYFQMDEAAVFAPNIVPDEAAVSLVMGAPSASVVEPGDLEMDLSVHHREMKSEKKWWIKVIGTKHDGTKTDTSINVDSDEKPEIEMYRFENGKKIRALVIVGREREVEDSLL